MNHAYARSRGFTLIELMVVVVIVAIIAAIAYPSYQEYVIKSRRTAASACLVELTQFMERYYTTNMSYEDAELPDTECQAEMVDHYSFAFTDDPTANAFEITATAEGQQAAKDTKCGDLTLDQRGTKKVSVEDTAPSDCF